MFHAVDRYDSLVVHHIHASQLMHAFVKHSLLTLAVFLDKSVHYRRLAKSRGDVIRKRPAQACGSRSSQRLRIRRHKKDRYGDTVFFCPKSHPLDL